MTKKDYNNIYERDDTMDKFQPIKKPLTYDKIVISIRIEESKLNEIDKIASLTDISRNEVIKQCIDFALDNLNVKKEEEDKENN